MSQMPLTRDNVVTWVLPIHDKGNGTYEITYDHPLDPSSRAEKATKRRPSLLGDISLNEYQILKRHIDEGDSDAADAAQSVGEILFTFLFGGNIAGAVLREWRAYAAGKASVLRLVLEMDRELADEPWEFLFHTEYEFLALNQLFSIVRCLRVDVSTATTLSVRSLEVPVLVLVSNPEPGSANDQLDAASEVAAIRESFSGAKVLDGTSANLRGLEEHLRQTKTEYSIVHFIGHGGAGKVLLSEMPVRGGTLALALQSLHSLRMFVLTSCASSEIIWPLVQLPGVPAVIAMQYDFYDRPAIEFSRVVYAQLSNGIPIDLAVNAARRRLANFFTGSPVWAYPTISIRKYREDSISFVAALDRGLLADQPGATNPALNAMPQPVSQPAASITGGQQSGGTESKKQAPTTSRIVSPEVEIRRASPSENRKAHDDPVTALSFIPAQNVLISGDRFSAIRAWRFGRLEQLSTHPATQISGTWTGHDTRGAILALVTTEFSGTSVALSAGEDGDLRAWRWQDGVPIGTAHTTASSTVGAMTADPQTGAVALVTTAGKLLYLDAPWALYALADTRDLSTLVEVRECLGVGSGITFSPDGKWLAAATQRAIIRLWDRGRDGKPLPQANELTHNEMGYVHSVAAQSPTCLVAGTESGEIWVWDVMAKSVLQQPINAFPSSVNWLVWFDKRKLLLGASPSGVGLWAVQDKVSRLVWDWKPALDDSVSAIAAGRGQEGDLFAIGLTSGSVLLMGLKGEP